MAHVNKQIRKRLISISLGVVLLITSAFLIMKTGINSEQLQSALFFGINPILFYMLGIVFGIERIVFGATGSEKLFRLLAGDGELYYTALLGVFFIFIISGVLILAYTPIVAGIIEKVLELINGLSFLALSATLFMRS
ncbi:conserved hypothetical protein [Sulfolobus islandicus Y.N.15.51]|uniref:Uncharacterized protein n=1 Tax=Saccharolobus islandicus (strain Y.N.15.51 / Yellowstone \|nr:hypothetical protein [Sulfolobus islandicus]ACP48460.1 conserved hypothetical protein [Sulfolobus islandicus Y.N.15.51]